MTKKHDFYRDMLDKKFDDLIDNHVAYYARQHMKNSVYWPLLGPNQTWDHIYDELKESKVITA
jgi:hypothetical protein